MDSESFEAIMCTRRGKDGKGVIFKTGITKGKKLTLVLSSVVDDDDDERYKVTVEHRNKIMYTIISLQRT